MQAVDANFQQGVSVDTKLTFFLVGDPGNKVVVNKIYTTNKLPDKDLIDDFSKADWNKGDATGTVEVKNNTLCTTCSGGRANNRKNRFIFI